MAEVVGTAIAPLHAFLLSLDGGGVNHLGGSLKFLALPPVLSPKNGIFTTIPRPTGIRNVSGGVLPEI